jgi:pimeloyl-[acyl-carrier protein] methyl ester esterase
MAIQLKDFTLLLLPGMDGTGDLFSDFIAALPHDLQTARVRYPTEHFLSYSQLQNLVREKSPNSPFVLLAESFSTPLALNYAATNPANLRALILCAGFATSPLHGWRGHLASRLAPLAFHIPLPAFAAKRWLLGPTAPPALISALRGAVSRVNPNVLSARIRAVLKCDARGSLSQITVPILYLRPNRDALVPAKCVEELRQIKPQMQVALVEGPHLLLQRDPVASAHAVLAFIRAIASD